MPIKGRPRPRRRPGGRRRTTPRKRTCEECRKYSRKTLYCAKHGKVLEKTRPSCGFFAPRRRSRTRGRPT